MTSRERAAQKDRVLRSMLLADTEAERHGDYANRKVKGRGARHHKYTFPVVNEKTL